MNIGTNVAACPGTDKGNARGRQSGNYACYRNRCFKHWL